MPTKLVVDLADDLVNPLCITLEDDHGLRMSTVTESLECVHPSPAEAKLLRARRTTPLLLLRQEIADPTGVRFEYTRILFRADKILLQFHYDPIERRREIERSTPAEHLQRTH